MELIYEGCNITDQVDIIRCVHSDTCGDRCDITEIELENAAAWYRWGPQVNDRIRIEHNGYTTGNMYLNTILPADGRYRIFATSIPANANIQRWAGYQDISLTDIIGICAGEYSMEPALYGIDGNIRYPFIMRRYESAARFAGRVLEMEGAIFKAYNGKFLGIGLDYAQKRDAAGTIEINAEQAGCTYTRSGRRIKSFSIDTPYASVTAYDTLAQSERHEKHTEYPARDAATAGRWARGILKTTNLECEELTISTAFSPAYTALMRMDVTGNTEASGNWLIKEAEHDLAEGSTRLHMARLITGVI